MKTKLVLAVMITSLFLLFGCSNTDDSVEESAFASKKSGPKGSAIDQTYPQAQAEVLETFMAIGKIIREGAGSGYESEYMNQLISYHAYGDKFVEFNNGLAFDSAGNEHNERQTFGVNIEEVVQFAAKEGTLKVAVYYGNVANLTFISDFIVKPFGGDEFTINTLITLLFVKTKGKWKMVHEHHSPEAETDQAKAPESKSASGYKSSVTDQTFTQAQSEVLTTFGAIAESITLGAGLGYGSGSDDPNEYMDKLISFHAYGPKFTEFNNGESFDSAGNEHNERQLFGEAVSKVQYFGAAPGTLKVAVYNGNVANLTFLSDFILDFKEGPTGYRVNNLITLLFVKINGEWKMVHEHHSKYTGLIDWQYPLD